MLRVHLGSRLRRGREATIAGRPAGSPKGRPRRGSNRAPVPPACAASARDSEQRGAEHPAARHHEEQHGQREHRIGARCQEGDAAGFGFLLVARLHDAEDLLLVRPDQHPDVEQHDRAQPRPDPDRHVRLLQEEECIEEMTAQDRGTRQPGDQRRPAEVQQRSWRDVLGDAGAGVVRLRRFECRHLNEVEVVQQPDPHHAGKDVQPADQPVMDKRTPVHGQPPIATRTTTYRTSVITRPAITVPHSESSGFMTLPPLIVFGSPRMQPRLATRLGGPRARGPVDHMRPVSHMHMASPGNGAHARIAILAS